MQTIVPASGIVMKVLGPQKKQNTAYRFMTFCVRRRVPEGELVFHTLTRQMILLEDGQPRPEDALIAAWFLVPEGCDDKKLAAQVRSVLQVMKQKPEHIRKYTIYTTSDCNARCFYCFERGWKRTYMTQQTARRTAAFIAEHCGGKPVILCISTNDGLAASARNLGDLLNRRHYYFVPFRQDDPRRKPASLVADYALLPETVAAAVQGAQIQPVLLAPDV